VSQDNAQICESNPLFVGHLTYFYLYATPQIANVSSNVLFNFSHILYSTHFRNKKKAYLKAKTEELENNSKINHVRDFNRGINDFRKG
jgi:hypothetical protein